MKKIFFLLFTSLFCSYTNLFAQDITESSFAKIVMQSPDYNVNFRLYPTTNMWTFLKLDTRSGIITHIQYSVDNENNQMEYPLNSEPLVDESQQKPGRFYLYPTRNMYNFILLDQISGKCWQVQWSTERNSRGIWRIY